MYLSKRVDCSYNIFRASYKRISYGSDTYSIFIINKMKEGESPSSENLPFLFLKKYYKINQHFKGDINDTFLGMHKPAKGQ